MNNNTDPATLKRPDYDRHLHAMMSAFQHAGRSEVFGGGPYGTDATGPGASARAPTRT